jgi:hypothetical protein
MGGHLVDPITIVVSALVAGAAAGLDDTAGQVVRDAYAALKNLLKRKLRGAPGADAILDRHEAKPDAWSDAVATILGETNAADNEEIQEAAKRVLELSDPVGSAAGKYNIVVKGGQVGVIGDHGTAYMGPEPRSGSEPPTEGR